MRGRRGGRSGRGGRYAGHVQHTKDKEEEHQNTNTGTGITVQQLEELIRRLPTPAKLRANPDSNDEILESNMVELMKCNHVTNEENGSWILDSGASHHVTGDLNRLVNVEDLNGN